MPGYDYRTAAEYFITICTNHKRCILSEIVGEGSLSNKRASVSPVVKLTRYGKIADEQLHLLESRFSTVSIDTYVIMPNHIHLILQLQTGSSRAFSAVPVTVPAPAVSEVIGIFKSQTTRLCGTGAGLFQRSFHDHIIRGPRDYQKVWTYIAQNPAKWAEDCFYSP